LVLGLSKTYFGGLNDVESWKQGMKRGWLLDFEVILVLSMIGSG
jgi:uncharacterized protein YecA (UPF0149 family)